MKVAIMQPYLFPYIGYFQLINAVDTFVIHDDVQYIKSGWINRNRILLNGADHLFSFGIQKDDHTKPINERFFSDNFVKEKNKLLGMIDSSYAKAPYYRPVRELLKETLEYSSNNISSKIVNSLKRICAFLGIETPFLISSQITKDNSLHGAERVMDLVHQVNGTIYINPVGGQTLYSKEDFQKRQIELYFLNSKHIEYTQGGNDFVPWLSIIDVLMFNSTEQVKHLLNEYELI